MARSSKLRGCCGRVREHVARRRAVCGADSRGGVGPDAVDGDGVGGAVGVFGGGQGHHLGQLEGRGAGGGEGRADVARGVADHEGHFGGGEGGGGDDEVAFVFARGGVEDDYEFVIC